MTFFPFPAQLVACTQYRVSGSARPARCFRRPAENIPLPSPSAFQRFSFPCPPSRTHFCFLLSAFPLSNHVPGQHDKSVIPCFTGRMLSATQIEAGSARIPVAVSRVPVKPLVRTFLSVQRFGISFPRSVPAKPRFLFSLLIFLLSFPLIFRTFTHVDS
jgi:hypothetical protein